MVNYFQLDLLGHPDEYPVEFGICMGTNCCDLGLACGEDIECVYALRYANVANNAELAPADLPPTDAGCDKYNALVDCANRCFDHWPRCEK